MLANACIFMSSVLWICEAIWNVDGASLDCRTADNCATINADRMFRKIFDVVSLGVIRASQMILAILQPKKAGIFRFTQTSHRLKDRVQNGLNVGWRT